jgi:spore germination cell wall hydrolase CwlJ-like protein
MIGRFFALTFTAASAAVTAMHLPAAPAAGVDDLIVEVRYAPTDEMSARMAIPVGASDYGCLVQAVFFDAGIDTDEAQRGVAHVVLNRMRDGRWPSTACNVVWQPRQFTWTRDGKPDLVPISTPNGRRALAAVDRVLDGAPDPTYGSTCYVRADATHRIAWTASATPTVQLGEHQFYRC